MRVYDRVSEDRVALGLPGNRWPKSLCLERSHGYSGNSLGPGAGGRGVPRCGICPSKTGDIAGWRPWAAPGGRRAARWSAWGTCRPGSVCKGGAAAAAGWWASDVGTSGWIGSGIRTWVFCRSWRDPGGLLGRGLPRGEPGEGGGDSLESSSPRPTILSIEKPSLGRVGVWITVEGVGIMTMAGRYSSSSSSRTSPPRYTLPAAWCLIFLPRRLLSSGVNIVNDHNVAVCSHGLLRPRSSHQHAGKANRKPR